MEPLSQYDIKFPYTDMGDSDDECLKKEHKGVEKNDPCRRKIENLKKNRMYHDDIIHILKYAEECNPHSLIYEVCQNFKWETPEIQSTVIKENNINVYKSYAKCKNCAGEGVGITKKISRKKACLQLLTKMLEDKMIRDSMRIYIDTKFISREGKIKNDNSEDEDEEEIKIQEYKESDLDYNRVKGIITQYSKDNWANPLSMLDAFKGRYHIPFCFTYTVKRKMNKAVLYVGGEIFGIGIDANIRVAKYKAAEEGVKKIKDKFGEEAVKYKRLERRKNKNTKLEMLKQEENIFSSAFIEPYPNSESLSHHSLEEIVKVTDHLCQNSNDLKFTIHRNLEITFHKLERWLIPFDDYLDIHRLLSLILHSGKTLSIHFHNPLLVGSFQYDCPSFVNKTPDLLFYHNNPSNAMKEAIDILIKNLKSLLKSQYGDLVVSIKRQINETNLDIVIKLNAKPYSFNLLLRDDQYKDIILYLKHHNSKLNANVQFPSNLIILRRLFRLWRRQHRLLFLFPEILDWIIKNYIKSTINGSIIKILKKGCSNITEAPTNIFNLPEVIKELLKKLNEDEVEQIQRASASALSDLSNGEIAGFLNFNEI